MKDDGNTLVGKLPPNLLERAVFRHRGATLPEVLVGPGVGEDASLIRWGNAPFLAVSSDPIVGASKGAGNLLVHINANDIACKGGDPLYFVATLIIPAALGVEFVDSVMSEISQACSDIGAAVVGGHTELTSKYDRPVLVGAMIGPTSFCYRATDIVPGDVVIATKHVALEGMSILAHDRPDLLGAILSEEEIAEVRSWASQISVLDEARALRDIARFMHDPTEGGLFGGLAEICRLCELDVLLDRERVPLSPLTERVRRALGFDAHHMISSGVLVAVAPAEREAEALRRLSESGIPAQTIGRMVPQGAGTYLGDGEELWRIIDLPSPPLNSVHEGAANR